MLKHIHIPSLDYYTIINTFQFKGYLANVKFKDKDTHNVNVLALDFPEVYMRNITKILYNKYCVDCNILPYSSLSNRNWNCYVGYNVQKYVDWTLY